MDQRAKGASNRKVTTTETTSRRSPKMTTTKILKSLLIASLLSCASAHANDSTNVAAEDSKTTASFKVSELKCKLIEGQVRCTFGS
jgi:hypothetical protein